MLTSGVAILLSCPTSGLLGNRVRVAGISVCRVPGRFNQFAAALLLRKGARLLVC